MTITTVEPVAMMVKAPGLDAIHVFWLDCSPGAGYVTVICYGYAWTAYFGAMSGDDIKTFFLRADVEYMVSKLSRPHELKRSLNWLRQIVEAVRVALRSAEGSANA